MSTAELSRIIPSTFSESECSSYGGVSVLVRYFTDFEDTSTQYVTLPGVTMSGDYSIDISFYLRDFANYMLLGDSVQSADNYLFVEAAGTIRWRVGGVDLSTTAMDSFDLNQVQQLNISRVGTTVTIRRNGVTVGSGTQAGNPTIDLIGYYGGSLFPFNGLVWDVDLNGQATYALDESGTTAIDSVAAADGTYVAAPTQSPFTQSVTATTTAWRADDDILTLFISDTRTHHEMVHLGDSLTTRMLEDTGELDSYVSYYDRVHNRRVTVFNYGVGSDTITQMLARVPAIRTTFNGRPNVLVVVCGGVNDFFDYGEYDLALQVNKDTMEADLRSIISSFELDSHAVAVTSIPYVGLAAIRLDENKGTLPWTTNINNVVISEDNAAWYSGGAPILDAYVKTKANYPDWYIPEEDIHYTPAGEEAFREWFADTIGPVISI